MPDYSSKQILLGSVQRTLYFRAQTSDEPTLKQIFADQDYDLSRLRRFPEIIKFAKNKEATGLHPLIIDAGANIGASALYFMTRIPNAKVISIEPDAENFELLCKNTEGTNIETIHAALGSTRGFSRVIDAGMGNWGYRTEMVSEAGGYSNLVPRVTINDLYEKQIQDSFPFIVKIDIEGGEGDLFSDNTEWVEKTPIIIIELHDWLMPKAGTSRSFLQCISRLDRDFVHIGENIFSIANQ